MCSVSRTGIVLVIRSATTKRLQLKLNWKITINCNKVGGHTFSGKRSWKDLYYLFIAWNTPPPLLLLTFHISNRMFGRQYFPNFKILKITVLIAVVTLVDMIVLALKLFITLIGPFPSLASVYFNCVMSCCYL